MKKILSSLIVSATLFFPGVIAHAANLPLLDPNFTIVPTECTAACPCGIGAALQFIQNIMNVMISLAVLAMTIFIVWAGFLFVMSATNPESRSKARGMLINAFIGLFIVLSAWLIVDFIMKQLYDGGGKFGPWNKILSTSSGSLCIEKHDPVAITGLPAVVPINIVNGTSGNGGGTSGGGNPVGGGYNGRFTYQGGIQAQAKDASARLNQVLTCMESRVPSGVGQISSISDHLIVDGQKTFQQCAQGGCTHTANSCHYGGRSCVGQSFAADFGDDQNKAVLAAAAQACGARTLDEGNHLHVSIGAASGCGCSL